MNIATFKELVEKEDYHSVIPAVVIGLAKLNNTNLQCF